MIGFFANPIGVAVASKPGFCKNTVPHGAYDAGFPEFRVVP
jgi:hypothetical protein